MLTADPAQPWPTDPTRHGILCITDPVSHGATEPARYELTDPTQSVPGLRPETTDQDRLGLRAARRRTGRVTGRRRRTAAEATSESSVTAAEPLGACGCGSGGDCGVGGSHNHSGGSRADAAAAGGPGRARAVAAVVAPGPAARGADDSDASRGTRPAVRPGSGSAAPPRME